MNYMTSTLQPIRLLINHSNKNQQVIKKKTNKPHVSAACANCKKAHLACDVSRPCQRCISTDKADSCHDIQHKKRGRPKMLRDSNNKKIRPTKPSVVMNEYEMISFPSDTASSSHLSDSAMTIFLSMDLCCARVTDQSLEYLQLYPQEFSHRSIYDFLVPGESIRTMSKVHRCLLDNAVQHQERKSPPDTNIRSSFDGFHSTPLHMMMNIANGSLTLKQKLTFIAGSGEQKREEEMDCRLFLGGGFGADLFDSTSLKHLYIVCILSPTSSFKPHQSHSNNMAVTASNNNNSLLTPDHFISEQQQQHQRQQQQDQFVNEQPIVPVALTPMFSLPPLTLNDPSSNTSSPTETNDSILGEEEEDYYDVGDDMDDIIDQEELERIQNNDTNPTTYNKKESDNTSVDKSPTLSYASTTSSNNLLDRFRQKNPHHNNKQFIHPHELYYLHTTSSRLSSEAIAHTTYPYLSTKLSNNFNHQGSSSLATYNLNKNNTTNNM